MSLAFYNLSVHLNQEMRFRSRIVIDKYVFEVSG